MTFKIKQALPSRKVALSGTKCLVALSVSDRRRRPTDYAMAFNWARKHFSEQAVVLGNSMYRLTLQVTAGLNEEAARACAIVAGEDYVRLFMQATNELPTIFRTTDLSLTTAFKDALEHLRRNCTSRGVFFDSVMKDATKYVARQHKSNNLAVPQITALELAVQYLLEELAAYEVLAGLGWDTEVYLGSELPTLKRFIDGEFSELNCKLSQRRFLELSPLN